MKQQGTRTTVSAFLVALLLLLSLLSLSFSETMNLSTSYERTNNTQETVDSWIQEAKEAPAAVSSDDPDGLEVIQNLMRFAPLAPFDSALLVQAYKISEQTPLDLETATILVRYSNRYSVDPSLVLAIIEKESNFNATLVGSHQDRGYMQIIPGTERWLIKAFGEELGFDYDPSRIFEAEYNLGLGICYIADLLNRHEDPHRALSEYNRGGPNLAAYYAANRTYQTGYSKRIVRTEQTYLHFNH